MCQREGTQVTQPLALLPSAAAGMQRTGEHLPRPLPRKRVCLPQLGPGGATLGTPTFDEETDTLVLYLYYNPSTGVGGEWYGALLKF
jgi:hypothetical protein